MFGGGGGCAEQHLRLLTVLPLQSKGMLGHTLEATLCGWLYAVSLFQCVSLSHGDLGVIESNSAHRNNLCMCVYACMSANMNARVLICLCACMPACLHTCMLACLHALVQAQATHTTDAMRLWTTLPLPVLELSVHVPVDEAALLINGLRTRRASGPPPAATVRCVSVDVSAQSSGQQG